MLGCEIFWGNALVGLEAALGPSFELNSLIHM